MQQVILAIVLFFTTIFMLNAQSQSNQNLNLTVEVTNATSNKGMVRFALYNKLNFMKEPIQTAEANIENGKSLVKFTHIVEGEYAVLCYHDENNNHQMDFDELGIPMESYGSSNNVMNFGPPQFESAKFTLNNKDKKIEIKF